jgi:chemotaxis protein methyltransferase CheR
MDHSGYSEIADLALRKTGQVFGANHRYLVEARLAPILRRENFSTLDELSNCLQARPNSVLELEVASALTGKDTQFFRDRKTLGRVISFLSNRAKMAASSGTKLRLLCAGGGTGQEAYSLVIEALETAPELFEQDQLEIVSVDICKASTARARAGQYGHFEIQMGLSAQRMLKYFSRSDNSWQAAKALRQRVSFSVCNLMSGLPELGQFDVVLCRNVLPAMARPIAIDVASQLLDTLQPWGQLVVGRDEMLPDGVRGLSPSRDVRNAFCPANETPRHAGDQEIVA